AGYVAQVVRDEGESKGVADLLEEFAGLQVQGGWLLAITLVEEGFADIRQDFGSPRAVPEFTVVDQGLLVQRDSARVVALLRGKGREIVEGQRRAGHVTQLATEGQTLLVLGARLREVAEQLG